MFGDHVLADVGARANRMVAIMMDVLRKSNGTFVIIHAGREVAKDFETEDAAWSWADENVDDQLLCTPNQLSAPLEYRTPLPNLRSQ